MLIGGLGAAVALGLGRGEERREAKRLEAEDRQLRLAQIVAQLAGTPGIVLGEPEGVLPEDVAGATERAVGEGFRTAAGALGLPGVTPPTFPEPEAEAEAAAAPSLREIARLTLGGQEIPVSFDPSATRGAQERKRTGSQRQAYDALHEADPEAYPVYVEGFDYVDELGVHAREIRAGKREEAEAVRGERSEARKLARERRRSAAELAAANLIQGNPEHFNNPTRILAVINSDPDLRGALTATDVQKMLKDFRSAGITDDRTKERRAAVVARYGRPATELEQDIADALAEGLTKDDILAELNNVGADSTIIRQARRYLNPVIR